MHSILEQWLRDKPASWKDALMFHSPSVQTSDPIIWAASAFLEQKQRFSDCRSCGEPESEHTGEICDSCFSDIHEELLYLKRALSAEERELAVRWLTRIDAAPETLALFEKEQQQLIGRGPIELKRA